MPGDPSAAEGSTPHLPDNEAFPFRVLIALPKVRSIPTFAMGLEKGRGCAEEAVTSGFDTDGAPIARHIASALQQSRYGPYQLVGTRTRTHPRTVVHATWAAFRAMAAAEAFQRNHPKLGLARLIERTAAILKRRIDAKSDRHADTISDLRWRLRAFEGLRQHVTEGPSSPRSETGA